MPKRLDPWSVLPPLPQLAEEYKRLFLTGDLSRGTRKGDASVIKHLVAGLGPKPDAREVRAYLAARVERGELMPSSANRYRDVARKMLGRMAQEYGVPNPLRDLAEFAEPELDPRALAVADPPPDAPRDAQPSREWTFLRIREQVAAILPLGAAFVSLLRYQGIRKGEALALERRHVRFDRGELRIEQHREATTAKPGPPKHGSKRTLDLHPAAAEALHFALSVHEPGDAAVRAFVFPWYAAHVERLSHLLRAVAPEEFPRHVQGASGGQMFHVFRHTFASDLLDLGYTVDEIWRLMGHRDPRWTFRYCEALRGRPAKVDLGRAARAHSVARTNTTDTPPPSGSGFAETNTTGRAAPKRAASGAKVVSLLGKLRAPGRTP